MTNELFEVATRKAYRYPYRGMISTEDLWNLNLKEIDSIYGNLMRAQRERVTTDSLLSEEKVDVDLANKIEIVKYVAAYKKEQARKQLEAKEKAQRDQQILALIAQKQNEQLADMSIEQLQELLNQ